MLTFLYVVSKDEGGARHFVHFYPKAAFHPWLRLGEKKGRTEVTMDEKSQTQRASEEATMNNQKKEGIA